MYDLKDLYLNQRKSTREIGKLLGVSNVTICKWLKAQNITARGYEANKMPVPKGGKLSAEHKAHISEATQGRIILNPETGHGYRWDKKEVFCSECGQKILRKACHINPENQYFCSPECKSDFMTGEDRGGKVKVYCTECNSELIRKRCKVKNGARFFCDQICEGKWKRKNLTGDKLYNYKGGYDKWENYGPSWPHAKFQARERDGHKCVVCGITREKLHKEPAVHHIIPFRFFLIARHIQGNNLLNLRSLCPKHHSEAEQVDNARAESYANVVRGLWGNWKRTVEE